MGNDAEAQVCFEKILSLDPGNFTFLMDLADIHFRRKEYKDAEERIKAYLIRRPNDRAAKLLLGKLYAETGNRTHAIQVFEELSKADPNDTEALAAAAELHKEAGSLEKALRTADTLVNLQGKRATTDDLLDLNKSLEFYENAVNAYSTSVKDMWNRNIKLMDGEGEDGSAEEDISLLMGAAGVSHAVDEETEALFIEDIEAFSIEEEEDRDLVLGDDDYGGMPEEKERPRYHNPLDDPLDDLVEPVEAGGAESPKGGSPPEPAAETPPAPAEPATRNEPPAPQMPQLPNYP
jgi:tetratricopeptide (TPR) repeat protein